MTDTYYNMQYLPLNRRLNLQKHIYTHQDFITTKSNKLLPTSASEYPIKYYFQAQDIHLSEEELDILQVFYNDLFMQHFLLKPIHNKTYDDLTVTSLPDGILTQFNLNTDTRTKHYWPALSVVYVDNQIQTDATLSNDLVLTFPAPPQENSQIYVKTDYDHIVMFDYNYGLKFVKNHKTKTHQTSFRLIHI